MLNLRCGCLSLVIASMLLVGCSSQEFKDNQKKKAIKIPVGEKNHLHGHSS
jgi:uncharacterized protein YcfL